MATALPYKTHLRETIFLAIPVCFSNIGHMMVDVADSYFLGQLGSAQQAAQMLSGAFYILALVFILGLSYGLTPLVASAHAQSDKTKIIALLRNSFLVNFSTSLVMLALLAAAVPLIHYLDQPPEVVKLAVPFLGVIMFSMIPLSVFNTLKQFTEGMSDTRAAMFISIGANVLNILLNMILVFGGFGIPAMGIMGSCWATFISRVLMAVSMWIYVYSRPRYRDYREGFRMRGFSRDVIKKLFATGIPSGLQVTFEVGAFSAAAVMVGRSGKEYLAAHRIALSLASLTYMVSNGIAAVGAIRVGSAKGRGSREDVRRAGFSAVALSFIFMLLSAAAFIIFRYPLTDLFNEDPTVRSIASSLLVIAAFFQISDGLQVTALGALRGLQDTLVPTWITLVAYWIIGLPVCWLLGITLGYSVWGVWYGFVIALSIAAAGLLLRFERVSRGAK